MKISNLSLPHPVLGLGDDVEGRYLVDCDVELSNEQASLFIKHNLENKTLEGLVRDGKAVYSVEVHCAQTFLRESFLSENNEHKISIPSSQLRNKVDVHFYVTASEDMSDYQISGANVDYSGYRFEVSTGDVLAYGGSTTFFAAKAWEALQAVSTFMEIQEYPEEEGPIRFELTGPKIIIQVSRNDKKKYDTYKGVRRLESIFHSEIVFPALIYSLYQMHKSPEDYEDLDWYQVLDFRLKEEEKLRKFDRDNPADYPGIAQTLLENPINRSWEGIELLTKSDMED